MVDTQLLKQLREATKAPFKDCKEALENSDGDFEEAKEYLRKKWAKKADEKAERETNEWMVKIDSNDQRTCWIKLGCETDFVAKSDDFQELAWKILDKFINDFDQLESIDSLEEGYLEETINPMIKDYVWKIWENIKLLDVFVDSEVGFVYTHPGSQIASVVYYEADWADNVEDVAKDIALQAAAMNPQYWKVEDIPEEQKESLKEEFKEEFKDSWKPENVIENIVEWKLAKHFGEVVLMEQPSIKDDSKKVKDLLPDSFTFKSFRRVSI